MMDIDLVILIVFLALILFIVRRPLIAFFYGVSVAHPIGYYSIRVSWVFEPGNVGYADVVFPIHIFLIFALSFL